jgi:hypothetical protein
MNENWQIFGRLIEKLLRIDLEGVILNAAEDRGSRRCIQV